MKLGNLSRDGITIHADASKSQAVSYKRLAELEAQLCQEMQKLGALEEQADEGERRLPEGLVLQEERVLREARLPKPGRSWKPVPRTLSNGKSRV